MDLFFLFAFARNAIFVDYMCCKQEMLCTLQRPSGPRGPRKENYMYITRRLSPPTIPEDEQDYLSSSINCNFNMYTLFT